MDTYRQALMESGETVEVPSEKAEAFRKKNGFVAFLDEIEQPSEADEELVPVETSAGTIWMKAGTERRTRDEREADDLAEAFDASMGAPEQDDQLQRLLDMRTARDAVKGATMNGQGMDSEMMEVLQQYMQEGRMDELFQPFEQQQQLIQQAQNAPRPSSPTGALLGGLSRVVGTAGQAGLNKKMQGDASGRLGALMEMYQKQKGIDPSTGLMAPAVDDATIASLFSGG